MITQHALKRVCERVGIRDEASAECFIKNACENGKESGFFPAGRLREYLDGKARTGNRVVVHMGIVVVFGRDGSCVTAYPLPAPLLETYRKETKHD